MSSKLTAPVSFSANYSWSTVELLGKGAFGQVYKGVHRKTGQEFAIKTFEKKQPENSKEVELLKKIKHRNVVQLVDVDSMGPNRPEIIVMELCNAGNLYSMLEEPQNNYGFEEEEFKLMLAHITAGMKHLHINSIVHRDLKPGNIMRTIDEEGDVTYKLTDFGTARELREQEEFTSLVGTKEYLHPDMFAALYRVPSTNNHFTSNADLWSLGVTLYHLATGNLPFRPFGGVRKNEHGMMQIISQKPPGVLSGQQVHANKEIKWETELPRTCRFSQSFRNEISPILRGILERSEHQVWTFVRYFEEVEQLLKKTVVHTFATASSTYQPIYIDPGCSVLGLQEMCWRLHKIQDTKSMTSMDGPKLSTTMLMDGSVFNMSVTSLISEIPITTPKRPLVVVTQSTAGIKQPVIPHTCKPPKGKQSTYDMDSNLARICCSTLYDIQKTVKHLMKVENMIKLSANWYKSHLKNLINQSILNLSQVSEKFAQLKSSLSDFEEHYRRETSLLKMFTSNLFEVNSMAVYFSDIQLIIRDIRETEVQYTEVSKQIERFHQVISVNDEAYLSITYDEQSCENLDRRILKLAEKSREISQLFKKHKHHFKAASNRQQPVLREHNENVHKFEKRRLSDLCDKAVKLFVQHSVPSCKSLHKKLHSWLVQIQPCHVTLTELDGNILNLEEEIQNSANKLRGLQRSYREKMDRFMQNHQSNNNLGIYPNGEPHINGVNDEELASLQRQVEMARENISYVTQQFDETQTNLSRLEAAANTSEA